MNGICLRSTGGVKGGTARQGLGDNSRRTVEQSSLASGDPCSGSNRVVHSCPVRPSGYLA